jgi:hypothetical protein
MVWRYVALLGLGAFSICAAILFGSEAPLALDLLVATGAIVIGIWYGRRYFVSSFRSAAAGRRPGTGGLIPLAVFLGMGLVPIIYPSTGVLGPLAFVGLFVVVASSSVYTVLDDIKFRRTRE